MKRNWLIHCVYGLIFVAACAVSDAKQLAVADGCMRDPAAAAEPVKATTGTPAADPLGHALVIDCLSRDISAAWFPGAQLLLIAGCESADEYERARVPLPAAHPPLVVPANHFFPPGATAFQLSLEDESIGEHRRTPSGMRRSSPPQRKPGPKH